MVDYKELDIWIKCRNLVKEVYILTNDFPQTEIYGITNQIRRIAVSIPSNIAEGYGRNSTKDLLQFLYVSRGSMYELETQLYIGLDLGYISQEKMQFINGKMDDCKRLINGFISFHRKKLT